jgi:molybdenum cofactor cytidylyltransferase
VGAVVLAAGHSSRMRGSNKLLEPLREAPVVAHVVDAALAAGAAPVVVVTGHQGGAIAEALVGRPITLMGNPRWNEGMSTSLSAGVRAVEGRADGALICLGDMPAVTVSDLEALIEAFRDDVRAASQGPDRALPAAWVPVHGGRRGNPVLWGANGFPRLHALRGDLGAKWLLAELGSQVREVPAGPGVLFDVDTPEALEKAREAPG